MSLAACAAMAAVVAGPAGAAQRTSYENVVCFCRLGASHKQRIGAMGLPIRRIWNGANPQSHYVQPHVTRDGSFSAGHFRTNRNPTEFDNFGTRGNFNPYTGTMGTRAPRR